MHTLFYRLPSLVSSDKSPAKRVLAEEEEQRSGVSLAAGGEANTAQLTTTRPVGQVVKTAASHAANRSSTLLRVTTFSSSYCVFGYSHLHSWCLYRRGSTRSHSEHGS